MSPASTRRRPGPSPRSGSGRASPVPSSPRSSVESDAPGAKGLVREYRVVDGLARFDIAVTVDKAKVRDKESVHLAFPFAVPGGTARVDVGWGFVRPEADQIAGACRDFLCARDGVDISNGEYGLTWTSLDAPLVEVGAMTDEAPRRGERRLWLDRLEPSTRLYSYAMNNYWHTNYKADQEGPVTLRYAVTPHRGPDGARAKKLALEAATPLVAGRGRTLRPRARLSGDGRGGGDRRHAPQAGGGRPRLDPASLQRVVQAGEAGPRGPGRR